MTEWQNAIAEVVREIANRSSPVEQIKPEQILTRDLGFSSLDYAELVASLELELDVDPFAKDVAITSIRSVDDLFKAYEPYFT